MKKKIFNYGIGILLAASLFINITAFIDDKPVAKKAGDECVDPCKKPYPGLPINIVKSMIDEYGNNQAAYINQGVVNLLGARQGATFEYSDARSVYYELDTIQQFLCTIKTRVSDNVLVKSDGQPIQDCDLGIKLYYAAYPNTTVKHTKLTLETYEGKHTLVIVATYRDADNTIKIFDPNYFYKDPIKNMIRPTEITSDWIKEQITKNSSILVMAAAGIKSEGPLARNHGTLCPPPSNCEDPLLTRRF